MAPASFDVLAFALLGATGATAIGAILALALSDHRPAMLASTVAGVGYLVGGVALVGGGQLSFRAGSVLGFGLIDVRFDGLSGVFLVALGIVLAAASIYALGYPEARRSRLDTFAYVAFGGSLALVFGAASAFSFLFAWELMALASAALVFGPHPDRGEVRAGYLYLALTHLASAAIAVAFGVWAAAAGSLDFVAFGDVGMRLDAPARNLLFLLILVGFGTKAGLFPLHVWLPRAHPVAPSHVSALMSGVMIKAGVYGIVRFGLELLGPGETWWGLLVIAAGAASAVLGVLYALAERDLKRLLAYSSIENVGIVLLGVGIAFVGAAAAVPALAVGGLVAALVHSANHAVLKALLFLGAGAVHSATHSRDLNRLGGLARAMPLTAVAFGLGAAAISGLPPLSGFSGEWLTFQSLLAAGTSGSIDGIARFAAFAAVGALGLTAALAVAVFVKATGMTFLALPRSQAAGEARDVGRTMRAALAVLAATSVVAALATTPIAAAAATVAGAVAAPGGSAGPVANGSAAAGSAAAAGLTSGGYEPLLVALALGSVVIAVAAFARLGERPRRRVPTWACGIAPEPIFEYTATSFSKPLRLFFEPVLRPRRELLVEYHAGTPVPRRVAYRSEIDAVVESRVFVPLHRLGIGLAQLARRLQHGSLQLYLGYTILAVVGLLLVARP